MQLLEEFLKTMNEITMNEKKMFEAAPAEVQVQMFTHAKKRLEASKKMMEVVDMVTELRGC